MYHDSHDLIKRTLSINKIAVVSVIDIAYKTHDVTKNQAVSIPKILIWKPKIDYYKMKIKTFLQSTWKCHPNKKKYFSQKWRNNLVE